MTSTEAVVLAILEGLTEFLPVSSTGHLVVAETFLNVDTNLTITKVFTIVIQLGAILSVVVLYWRRFFQSVDFYMKLFVAFLPAAVIGLLLHHQIETLLKSPTTVAVSFIVGGVILIFIDRAFKPLIEEGSHDVDTESVKVIDEFGVERTQERLKKFPITWMQAFFVGCFQCLGMIPGVSRSAATITGGLFQKLNIKKASEFSFFLGVPTIFAASLFELKSNYSYIRGDNLDVLILGTVVSFIVGMLAIKFFISLITRYGLKFFGIYRIIFGAIILILLHQGYQFNFKDKEKGTTTQQQDSTVKQSHF